MKTKNVNVISRFRWPFVRFFINWPRDKRNKKKSTKNCVELYPIQIHRSLTKHSNSATIWKRLSKKFFGELQISIWNIIQLKYFILLRIIFLFKTKSKIISSNKQNNVLYENAFSPNVD